MNRKPRVIIVEEPASKSIRFRYECEGRSAGSIPGVNSTTEHQTYPTIKVLYYTGPVCIFASCVATEEPHRPHPHKLVGNGCANGFSKIYFEVTPEDNEYCFERLGVQCVKKTKVRESLDQRQRFKVDPFKVGFDYGNTYLDLNSVRLAFQVILLKDNQQTALRPILSAAIYDKKSNAELVICGISDTTSYPEGKKPIILLCEKVVKDDIKIRFQEFKDGKVAWEGFGNFEPKDVHRQVAIKFRPPQYRKTTICDPVDVFITLHRPSSLRESKPIPFQYIPNWTGTYSNNKHASKKRKIDANMLFHDFIKTQIYAESEIHDTPNNFNEMQPAGDTSFPNTSSRPQVAGNCASVTNTNQTYNLIQLPPFNTFNILQNQQLYNDPQTSRYPPQPGYNIAPPDQHIVQHFKFPDIRNSSIHSPPPEVALNISHPDRSDLDLIDLQKNAQQNGIIQPAVVTETTTEPVDEVENMTDSFINILINF